MLPRSLDAEKFRKDPSRGAIFDPAAVGQSGLADWLVAKPVTPERLQPLIERLHDSSIN